MNATWPFDGQPSSEKLLETGDFRGILTRIMKIREITWALLPIVVTVLSDLAPGQTLAWNANGTGTHTLGTPVTRLFVDVKVIRNWAFSTRSSTWMAACC